MFLLVYARLYAKCLKAALQGVAPHVIYGMGAQQLAGKLEKIDHLSLSPELLTPLLTRLIDSGTKRLESQERA